MKGPALPSAEAFDDFQVPCCVVQCGRTAYTQAIRCKATWITALCDRAEREYLLDFFALDWLAAVVPKKGEVLLGASREPFWEPFLHLR